MRGTTEIGPETYKVLIICNKLNHIVLDVNLADTMLDIKEKISTKYGYSTDVQSVFVYQRFTNTRLYSNNYTLQDLYGPRILAIRIETLIKLTIDCVDFNPAIANTEDTNSNSNSNNGLSLSDSSRISIVNPNKKLIVKDSDTLVDSILEITNKKMILTSLLCTFDDRYQRQLVVSGFIKQKILNIVCEKSKNNYKNNSKSISGEDDKQNSLFEKYRFDENLIGVMSKYCFNDENIIDIFTSIGRNKSINLKAMKLKKDKNTNKEKLTKHQSNDMAKSKLSEKIEKSSKDNALKLGVLLYKQPNKKFYTFSQLKKQNSRGKLPKFQVYFYTLTGKRITIRVNIMTTIAKIKSIVESREGIHSYSQIFIFNHQILNDNQTLHDYCIGPDTRLSFQMTR